MLAMTLALSAKVHAGLDQPENLQGLCAVFDGLDINTVTDSNEQLKLGLISGLRSLQCRDSMRAKLLLERSAMQDNAEAQFHLCKWYSDNEDAVSVIAWCKLSSENGSADGKRAYEFYKNSTFEAAYIEGLKKAERLRSQIDSNSNKSLKAGTPQSGAP